jgi:hypothetical protein
MLLPANVQDMVFSLCGWWFKAIDKPSPGNAHHVLTGDFCHAKHFIARVTNSKDAAIQTARKSRCTDHDMQRLIDCRRTSNRLPSGCVFMAACSAVHAAVPLPLRALLFQIARCARYLHPTEPVRTYPFAHTGAIAADNNMRRISSWNKKPRTQPPKNQKTGSLRIPNVPARTVACNCRN